MTALDRLSLFFLAGGVLLVGSTASAGKPPFLAKKTVAESCPLRCPSNSRCVKMDDLGIELDNGKGYSIHGESGQVYYHGDMLHQDGWVCEQSCPAGTMGAGCSRRVQACGSGDDAKACLHGGECIENQDSEASEQFVCDCNGAFDFRASTGDGDGDALETVKYVGRYCEEVVESSSYCARDAKLFCINGGTCRSEDTDDFDTKPCDCPETHTGKHCEFDVTVAPLACTLDCGHHGECRNGRKKDNDEGADAHIDFSDKESMNYMYCECHSGHTGALCEYDFISCGDEGEFEQYCFHGSECEQFGDKNVCSCKTANGRVAGDACQYMATDECERVTGGATPNGAQFCVNNGTCEQELATGTTYCKCGDGFGGNQCEAPMEDEDSEDSDDEDDKDSEDGKDDKDDEEDVPKSTEWPAEEELEVPAEPEPAPEPAPAPAHRSPTIHLKFEPENQAAPTPAPTPKATNMGSMDGTYMDQGKFFDLDFPLVPNDGKHGAPKAESAHHHGDKKSSSTTEEGLSAAGQFGVFILLASLLTVLAVFVYRRHRRRKFSKEVIAVHSNTNLRSGADGTGDGFKDQVYKDAIYDADGKLDAVEIL